MSAPDPSRRFAALLRRLRSEHGGAAHPAPEHAGLEPLVAELIASFLAWEAGPARAEGAMRRLLASVVDTNELRVCLPDELASFIGARYPRAQERMARLKSALNDLYRREHAVTLAPLLTMPKRDARAYLESLEGVPGFVAARVTLLGLDGHAFPVDERIAAALRGEQAAPTDAGPDAVASWLERQVHSGEAREAYLVVEAWLRERAARSAPASRSSPRRTEKGPGSAQKR